MDSTATPITAKERIYTLDVIRGFALLGIFIMNMPWFNTSFFEPGAPPANRSPARPGARALEPVGAGATR